MARVFNQSNHGQASSKMSDYLKDIQSFLENLANIFTEYYWGIRFGRLSCINRVTKKSIMQ
ncbi:hypothetical protein BpHYR1_052508 [Brachionus plicatilis]|uniref:Uncharacterized protein n=1 Tax=Brachionus plicatilis TaxID=10195 RepID=A0A3M7QM20_BRAPC|nr:hypothetical protein BpHYR1_052508 [Brachionus plicatilis]